MANQNKKQSSTTTEQKGELQLLDRLIFYVTVSICGGSVMMIELMGTRIIGPYYGVSLIVWSSLLSVALLALSIGYFYGGRLADKAPWFRLSHIVLLAAVSIGFIPWISEPVQLAMNIFGLRMGALSSAFVLFTFPLIMLGMVGPYTIKMATRRLDVIGATVGNVYAVSTLGSVLGTLLLGFYLLPIAGVQTITWSLSGVLVLLALGLSVYEFKHLPSARSAPLWRSTAYFIIAGSIVTFTALKPEKAYSNYTVLFEEESDYGWVRVVDQKDGDLRFLLADSSTIGAESISTGNPMLAYQEIVSLIPAFNREGKDLLLIGLGSGHMVTTFGKDRIVSDTMEIDASVAKAAELFFNYKPTGRSFIGDARYQIKQLDKKYDFIVHDCFTGGSEPIHLLSKEMISELKALLKPGGVLALNFVGFQRENGDESVQSVAATLDSQFSHRKNFVSMPGEEWNDFIFFVSDNPLEIKGSSRPDMNAKERLAKHEIAINGENGLIITDNYNPLESMQLSKAEYYRDILLERLGEDILFR